MLKRILAEIEMADGAIQVTELSRKLDIDPAALAGMIAFLQRKGHLGYRDMTQEAKSSACAGCALSGTRCSAAFAPREPIRGNR
jgi:FeoC like transcriptional regulator